MSRRLRIAGVLSLISASVVGAEATDAEARPTRPTELWVTSGAPLAHVTGAGITTARCPRARYVGSRPGESWIEVDRWGQRAGDVVVTKSWVYNLTGCRTLEFSSGVGSHGAGLFVRAGDFHPRASYACPSSIQKDAMRAEVAQLTGAVAPVQLFCLPPDSHGLPRVFAAASGSKLIVARRVAPHRWDVALSMHTAGAPADAFAVKAILDMDGDGVPEIVLHEKAIDTYDDVIVAFDPRSDRWRVIVRTAGSGYA